MTDFLLRIFGFKTTGAGNITDVELAFHGINPAWVVLFALVLGALVFWMYRRAAQELSPFRKYALASLRALFILLILGLLLKPVLRVTFEHIARRTVLVLIDTSASMSQIPDQRSSDEDLKRVAMLRNLIDPTKGLSQNLNGATGLSQVPRLDLVKAGLKNETIDLLPRLARNFDLAAFVFDRRLAEMSAAGYRVRAEDADQDQIPSTQEADLSGLDISWIDTLVAAGSSSAVGDSIREVISRKRGQPIAGIVLVTDGASNSGVQPLDAAKLAGQDRVPLYIWGVGITSPRDIIVNKTILSPEVAFAKDEVPVTVRIRSMGMIGQTASLMVRLGEEKTEKEITFSSDGEQVITVKLTPKTPGDFEIVAAINPRDDEVVKDNNQASSTIKVIDGKIKVLLVEQSPRWEFKYLQAMLTRDRRIEFKCVLFEGDAELAKYQGSPYLADFPKTKEDLFKYDLVILGDVDPKLFSTTQIEMIDEFVSKLGGSLVMIAGKRFMPSSYRRTPIEKLLPVELESADLGSGQAAIRPIRLELTPEGRLSQMMRLAESEIDSAGRWAAMPPIYWTSKVARSKPSAQVLLVDPDPSRSSRYGKMPVIAVHQPGRGSAMFVGTDNLWRWRKNAGDKYHSILWGQVVQRMALPHLLGASKRTQLTTDQREYTTGSPVTIFARLYTEGFEPMTEPMVRGTMVDTTGRIQPRQVLLSAMKEQPGMYRAQLPAPAPGAYAFSVDHDTTAKLELAIADPQQELAEPAMNQPLLEKMAAASGGQFFREEDLHTLPDKLTAAPEHQRSTMEREVWASPFYFLLMLGVVTTEWILRKVSQLK